MADTAASAGCAFDAATAKAVAGKKIIMMVMPKDESTMLAVSGQTGLSFNVKQDTTEVSETKDEGGSWKQALPSGRSWGGSIDGLMCFDDEGRIVIAKAIANGEYLCIGVYEKVVEAGVTKYVPVRKGLALVDSDDFDAPVADNVTYSTSFTGSGELWMRETQTAEAVEAATITVNTATE